MSSYFIVFISVPRHSLLSELDLWTPDVDHGCPHPVHHTQPHDHEAEVDLAVGVRAQELIAGNSSSF